MAAYPFLTIYLVPVAVLIGYRFGGAFHYLVPGIVFGLVPLIDWITGPNHRNPSPEMEASLLETKSFRFITWMAVPVQLTLMLWGAAVVASGRLTIAEAVGLTLSIGISGGVIGINVSHELIHRKGRWEPFLGRALLLGVMYLHWSLEHVFGHHRWVGTPRDPATARYGESLYRFLPRSIFGGFASAWVIEAGRLERRREALWGSHNRLLRYLAATTMFLASMGLLWGPIGVLYFVSQSATAIILLEIVNYIEHYGIRRRKISPNRYEPVQAVHSWNSAERLTNWLLFNLQRHSDHHARPQRRYQVLLHLDEAPQLPTGYAGMLLLALIPPLWFKVMDARLPAEMIRLSENEKLNSSSLAA